MRNMKGGKGEGSTGQGDGNGITQKGRKCELKEKEGETQNTVKVKRLRKH